MRSVSRDLRSWHPTADHGKPGSLLDRLAVTMLIRRPPAPKAALTLFPATVFDVIGAEQLHSSLKAAEHQGATNDHASNHDENREPRRCSR